MAKAMDNLSKWGLGESKVGMCGTVSPSPGAPAVVAGL
jgi:hypothetical protein